VFVSSGQPQHCICSIPIIPSYLDRYNSAAQYAHQLGGYFDSLRPHLPVHLYTRWCDGMHAYGSFVCHGRCQCHCHCTFEVPVPRLFPTEWVASRSGALDWGSRHTTYWSNTQYQCHLNNKRLFHLQFFLWLCQESRELDTRPKLLGPFLLLVPSPPGYGHDALNVPYLCIGTFDPLGLGSLDPLWSP
jgi:hypothetical protein